MTIEIALKEAPLVAILRGVAVDEVAGVGETLITAGFKLIEVTMNSPRPLESIGILAKLAGKSATIGAGTVTSVQDVMKVKDVGGQFIISLNMDEAVIKETKRRDLVSLPGVFTPSEAFKALEYGADGIKIFPAEAISPQVVKAYRAVLPAGTRMFIVGGITASNIKSYLVAGADGVGIGSSLVKGGKSLSDIKRDADEMIASYHATIKEYSQ